MAILPSSRDTHHTNGPDLNPCLNFIPCQFQSFTISLPCSTQPHAKHTTMLQHQHKLHFSAIHPHHHLDSVNFLFLLPCQCLQILKKCFSPQVSSYGLIMFFFFFLLMSFSLAEAIGLKYFAAVNEIVNRELNPGESSRFFFFFFSFLLFSGTIAYGPWILLGKQLWYHEDVREDEAGRKRQFRISSWLRESEVGDLKCWILLTPSGTNSSYSSEITFTLISLTPFFYLFLEKLKALIFQLNLIHTTNSVVQQHSFLSCLFPYYSRLGSDKRRFCLGNRTQQHM